MKQDAFNLRKAHRASIAAALRAGALMKANLHRPKKQNAVTCHDIKLELDVRCQKIIETDLGRSFPEMAILGEEGISGDAKARFRWVIDPIDGTVNFSYGIPHAAVSIALQEYQPGKKASFEDSYATISGVVYDPFCSELWTAMAAKPALLNGKPVRVSRHTELRETVVSIGFAKTSTNISKSMPYMLRLARRVRKIRIMGSAALGLVYVAGGRFDAYVERGLQLWDIAAGGFIAESAGGEFYRDKIRGKHSYSVVCTNGRIRSKLRAPI